MQIDKEKFLALSLSMTLGGAVTVGCKKKPINTEIKITDIPTDPYAEGYMEPVEEYYPSDEYYSEEYFPQDSYGPCDPVIEVASNYNNSFYSYSTYDECYIQCFQGDQTQCYLPDYECTNWAPTSECIGWTEVMRVSPPQVNSCVYWEVFETQPGIPTIECAEYQ